LQEYRKRSDSLTKLLPNLVYTALAHHLRACSIERKDEGRVLIDPFEIITIGGDDLLLIVPSTVALPIALEIGERFAQKVEEQLGEWLTMSAGVVIADHHNPIRFLHGLAEQLLKSAKKCARESKVGEGEGDGAVDFVVLKSQSMLSSDLSDLRRRIYQFTTQPHEQVWLTGRPYLWRDMDKLLRHARLLRDTAYPRSQVQALRRVLREGRRWGRLWPSLWYLRQQMRASRTRRAVMQWLDREWSVSTPQNSGTPPWICLPRRKDVDRYVTVWEDLHEIRELLPKLTQEPEEVQQQAKSLMQEVLGKIELEEAYES